MTENIRHTPENSLPQKPKRERHFLNALNRNKWAIIGAAFVGISLLALGYANLLPQEFCVPKVNGGQACILNPEVELYKTISIGSGIAGTISLVVAKEERDHRDSLARWDK